MKNKKLFLIVYISFVIITIIALIILSILGSKSRIGYLSNFKLNIELTLDLNNLSNIVNNELDEKSLNNYLLTNENITNYVYNFRIRYYDKNIICNIKVINIIMIKFLEIAIFMAFIQIYLICPII